MAKKLLVSDLEPDSCQELDVWMCTTSRQHAIRGKRMQKGALRLCAGIPREEPVGLKQRMLLPKTRRARRPYLSRRVPQGHRI